MMNEPDPSEAESLEDLAECLKQLHIRADTPTYRELEQQTIHANGSLPGTHLKRARLGRTTLSDVLGGRKFPSKKFMLTFVDACGIDLEEDSRWAQAWDRLAPRYLTPGAVIEVEELRQKVAVARAAQAEADQAREAAEKTQQEAQAEVERLRAELAKREAELKRVRAEATAVIEVGEEAAEARIDEPQQAAAEEAAPYVTPLVKSLAAKHDVDLRKVRGTGVGGRIRRQDILDVANPTQQQSTAATASAAGGFTEQNALAAEETAGSQRVMRSLLMPLLGERTWEGVVTRWLKREGDRVEEGEPLFEVSAHGDDVDEIVEVECPSPVAGFLREIIAAVGESAAVGVQVGIIEPYEDS
jgi:pyruvate/2-oxoglutarate dehydrogenase complex dihydrolipoamide acyltransferase (E2) component